MSAGQSHARCLQPPGPELTSVEREGRPDLSLSQKDLVGRDKNINYLNVNIFPNFFIKLLLLLRIFRLKSYKKYNFLSVSLVIFCTSSQGPLLLLKGKK